MSNHFNPAEINDPFLTHSKAIQRYDPTAVPTPDAPESPQVPVTKLAEDPFLTHTHGGNEDPLNVKEDPFLTHSGQVTGPPGKWPRKKDIVHALLGDGDPDRKKVVWQQMALLTWLIFTWALLLWLLLRHYSFQTATFLTLFIVLFCVWLVISWLVGRSSKRAPMGAVGMLGILATCGGVGFGALGWHNIWRQYWWTQTGFVYEGSTADTPAGARLDASVVGFVGEDGALLAGTSVDVFRSAGYKDGHTYCVAPVLHAEASANELSRVNYWAIGIDCCESLGSFHCDDTRNGQAGYGVVVLGDGYPCPTCNTDRFQAAIAKAESTYGLVSAYGALNVRWVQDPSTVQWQYAWRAISYILLCIIFANPACLAVSYAFWYKGIGKGQPHRTTYIGGAPDKENDTFANASDMRAKMTGRQMHLADSVTMDYHAAA